MSWLDVPGTFSVPASMALVFVLRLAAIRYDLHAPSVSFGDDRPAPSGKLKKGA